MSEPIDPLDTLRRLRPARPPRELRPGEDPQADALLARVRQSVTQADGDLPGVSQRWRRVVGGGLVVGVIGVASAAAANLFTTETPDDPREVSCWEEAEPSSAQYAMRLSAGSTPAEICREPWTNGIYGRDGPPALTSCVTDQSIVAVIPGGPERCETLGFVLLDPDASPDPMLEVVDELERRLNDAFGASCLDEPETRRLVASVLADPKFADWSVEQLEQFGPQRTCGQVVVDVETLTVFLVPIPPEPTSG